MTFRIGHSTATALRSPRRPRATSLFPMTGTLLLLLGALPLAVSCWWSAATPLLDHPACPARVAAAQPRQPAQNAARTPRGHAAASLCARQPPRGETRTRLYRDGRLELEGFPVADISDHRP